MSSSEKKKYIRDLILVGALLAAALLAFFVMRALQEKPEGYDERRQGGGNRGPRPGGNGNGGNRGPRPNGGNRPMGGNRGPRPNGPLRPRRDDRRDDE